MIHQRTRDARPLGDLVDADVVVGALPEHLGAQREQFVASIVGGQPPSVRSAACAKSVELCGHAILVNTCTTAVEVLLAEVHALGQRQLRRVVDRVGRPCACRPSTRPDPDSRPPPVCFSPPNAPPISAPDVPMLTLAMPQSEPSADMKRSASRIVGGEDGRRKPLRHSVVQLDRVVELVVGQHVEDRRERLLVHHLGLRGHPHDRGRDVVGVLALAVDSLTAAQTSPPSARARSSAPTMSR